MAQHDPQHYLLPCTCGKEIAVLPRHAGEQRTCECGKSLEVPTYREIKKLAIHVDHTAPPTTVPSNWSMGHGLCFALGVPLIMLSVAWIGYSAWLNNQLRFTAPSLQDVLTYSPDNLNRVDFEKLTLVDSWEKVWKTMREMTLSSRVPPYHVEAQKMSQRLKRRMLIGTVGAFLGFLAVIGSILSSRVTSAS